MQPYTNPNYYSQYMQPAPVQQLARQVSDFNEITIGDIPTNGATAYFIKMDGSEIQSRRWTEDGRIVTSKFLPQKEEPQENPLEEIKKRLDVIEEKLTPAKNTRRKNEDEQSV